MHGDINGRCIYVESSGRVVLTDFGLAQTVASNRRFKGSLGNIRMVAGVEDASYLAPERVQGQGPTRSADIYALGVLAYQLLAGEPPFSGEQEAVLEAHVYKTPPVLQTINRAVSSSLGGAVTRALSKKPELRYNTATEFSRAFLAAAEGIAPDTMTAPLARLKPERRRTLPTPVAVILALALGLLIAFGLWNLAGWGDQLATGLQGLVPDPVSRVSTATSPADQGADLPIEAPPPANATSTTVPAVTPTGVATPTELPPTATATAPPTVKQGTVAEGSPFTNLVLARGIDDNYQPLSPDDTFEAGAKPVYLFFDYRGVQADTSWGHVWLHDGEEMGRTVDTWSKDWGSAGAAWVFYAPLDDYQPGSYQVQLLVDDEVVATAGFVMR